MRPEQWERKSFELTPIDQLETAVERSDLTDGLAALERQCGYRLSNEFVFQYETDVRRAAYYNTRKNSLAIQAIPLDARVQDELFSLSQIQQEHSRNLANFSSNHFDGIWPRHLIPIGSDGNGGRLAVEAGHVHFSPVVLLRADPFDTITVADSIGAYLQLQRAIFAMEIYIALTMMTPAERQSAIQQLQPDGQYSNYLYSRRRNWQRSP